MAKRARFTLLETIPERARFIQLQNHPRMSKVHSAARRAQLNLAPTDKERGPKVDLKLCRAPVFGARFSQETKVHLLLPWEG